MKEENTDFCFPSALSCWCSGFSCSHTCFKEERRQPLCGRSEVGQRYCTMHCLFLVKNTMPCCFFVFFFFLIVTIVTVPLSPFSFSSLIYADSPAAVCFFLCSDHIAPFQLRTLPWEPAQYSVFLWDAVCPCALSQLMTSVALSSVQMMRNRPTQILWLTILQKLQEQLVQFGCYSWNCVLTKVPIITEYLSQGYWALYQFLVLRDAHRLLNLISVFDCRGTNTGVGNWGTFEDGNFEVAFLLNWDGSIIA